MQLFNRTSFSTSVVHFEDGRLIIFFRNSQILHCGLEKIIKLTNQTIFNMQYISFKPVLLLAVQGGLCLVR